MISRLSWLKHLFIASTRPLAYSTLADLVHHIRTELPLNNLSHAVNLFSKNVHDESLPNSIQTISCKLLLNLVESIRLKSEQGNGNVRIEVMYVTLNVLENKNVFLRESPRKLGIEFIRYLPGFRYTGFETCVEKFRRLPENREHLFELYSLQGRELLMRMLEVFVLKFKTIAQLQLPAILAKWWVDIRLSIDFPDPTLM